MSSDFNCNFGIVVEEIVVPGHIRKSRCLQLLRPGNAWYFYTDISAGSRGNFGGKWEELLTAGYVVFEKSWLSDTRLVQFVQNQNINKY